MPTNLDVFHLKERRFSLVRKAFERVQFDVSKMIKHCMSNESTSNFPQQQTIIVEAIKVTESFLFGKNYNLHMKNDKNS